jgi:hypothetical protein
MLPLQISQRSKKVPYRYWLGNTSSAGRLIILKNGTFNLFLFLIIVTVLVTACSPHTTSSSTDPADPLGPDPVEHLGTNTLPEPDITGAMTLEETLAGRHSIRAFQDTPLTEAQINQLLWAAQGITHGSGLRTAPSAGALYPLEVYAATQDGLFR